MRTVRPSPARERLCLEAGTLTEGLRLLPLLVNPPRLASLGPSTPGRRGSGSRADASGEKRAAPEGGSEWLGILKSPPRPPHLCSGCSFSVADNEVQVTQTGSCPADATGVNGSVLAQTPFQE